MTETYYFVDTNIFVYALDKGAGKKGSTARELVSELWKNSQGRTSIQVLGELFSVLTRKYGVAAEKALQEVNDLLSWDPLPIDAKLFRLAQQAFQAYRLSWWDSQIVAAADLLECPVLLSEDLASGVQFLGAKIVNPFVGSWELS